MNKASTLHATGDQCIICLDKFIANDKVAKPDCKGVREGQNAKPHVFHEQCLRKWALEKNFCPTCKDPLDWPLTNVEILWIFGNLMWKFGGLMICLCFGYVFGFEFVMSWVCYILSWLCFALCLWFMFWVVYVFPWDMPYM